MDSVGKPIVHSPPQGGLDVDLGDHRVIFGVVERRLTIELPRRNARQRGHGRRGRHNAQWRENSRCSSKCAMPREPSGSCSAPLHSGHGRRRCAGLLAGGPSGRFQRQRAMRKRPRSVCLPGGLAQQSGQTQASQKVTARKRGGEKPRDNEDKEGACSVITRLPIHAVTAGSVPGNMVSDATDRELPIKTH